VAECNDNNACTTDACVTAAMVCTHAPIPGCTIGQKCQVHADCNDKNACTADLCLDGICTSKAITCNDYNPCTYDACDKGTGQCSNQPIPACQAKKCATVKDCNDANPCTTDACLYGWCNYTPIPGCLGPPVPK
jgi:hypothetical protein